VADTVRFVALLRFNFWLVSQGIYPFLPTRRWWTTAHLRKVIVRNPPPEGWVSELQGPDTYRYVYSSDGFRGYI
jgi:hypothetical protein